MSDKCEYTLVRFSCDNYTYKTSCGFYADKNSLWVYCPYCGKELK